MQTFKISATDFNSAQQSPMRQVPVKDSNGNPVTTMPTGSLATARLVPAQELPFADVGPFVGSFQLSMNPDGKVCFSSMPNIGGGLPSAVPWPTTIGSDVAIEIAIW